MQNNKVTLEPAIELHSPQDVHQNVLDSQDSLPDHQVMQQLIEMDNSLTDSECFADFSIGCEDVIIEEVPTDVLCEVCCYFLHTDYDKALAHRALLEQMVVEADIHGVTENLKFHLLNCCLPFYATHLDNVASF